MKKSITLLSLASVLSVNAASVEWTETFESPESFSAFTVKDVNNDGNKWEYNSYNQCARVAFGDLAMNDWLITPSFTLEGGVNYKFSLDAKNYMGAEKFEVFVGNAATVESMTIEVIPVQSVTAMKWQTYEGEFTVPETGAWYVGIHGCSDPDKLYLDVDNLKLKEGVNPASPAAVSNLEVIADVGGLNIVTVKCTLPSTDVSGNPLTLIDKVEVLCDDAVVEMRGGSTGGAFEWVHDFVSPGSHKYTVVVYADMQRGRESSAEVFVGPDKPSPVPYLAVGEFTPGDVTIRWNAPATDINGKQLNPELITYKVVRYEVMEGSLYFEEDIEGAEDISANEYIHHAIDADAGQMFTAYGVYAKTVSGNSTAAKAPLFPVGTNYAAPWGESFAGGESASLYRSETVAYDQVTPSWDVWADETHDVKSVDGDGGYLVMAGLSYGDCARYYSGKIDLTGLSAPALSFYVYNNPNGEASTNPFEIYVSDGRGFSFVKEFTVGELPAAGWNLVTVALNDYVGKTVQFAFQLTVENSITTLVDNLQIGEYYQTDLAVTALKVDESVTAGRDFSVAVRVENRGSVLAENYNVDLYRDDVKVQTIKGTAISPDGVAEMIFTENISVFAVDDVTYHATVNIDADADNSNNSSAVCEVKVVAPAYPAPETLAGTVEGRTVTLNWTEPAKENAVPDAVTDDFESYESFATDNVGEWSFVDVDKAPIGKLTNIIFPGITVEYQSSSFWVNDATLDCLNTLFDAHSGNKYLAQMFTADKTRCDDWAISPELYPIAQTISFYAKSYSTYIHEEMEVLYSKTGKDVADFISVMKINDVPNAWTKYEAELPQDAKYFALRCTSNDCYLLFIDDVTFTPLHGGSTVEHVGYNVYRDGEKINAQLVTETTYTDTDVPTGIHEYCVTAVYENGESLPSEIYSTSGSGLTEVTESSACQVRGGVGCIEIQSVQQVAVAVYGVDGKQVSSLNVDGNTRIEVASGVYLVKINNRSYKVVVK